MANVNLAKAFGYESEGAAIVFAILYIPLLGWYIRQSFARPTYVHIILALFCIIRIGAFVLRALLISMDSVGSSLSALIADVALFGAGYFTLLYSSYTLVLDLEIIQGRPESANPLVLLTKNRRIFRLALLGAVVLGILTLLFLALTLLQAFQTVVLAQAERSGTGGRRYNEAFGARHSMTILALGALLLVVRELFYTATVVNTAKQNNEHFWYPLVAIPELLVVALLATPGLVPRRDEIRRRVPEEHQLRPPYEA